MGRTRDAVFFFAFAGMFSASPLPGQTAVWQIDPARSTAHLYIASSYNRDARISIGVAQLSGEILQSADNSLPGMFVFQIYPVERNETAVEPKKQETPPSGVGGTGSPLISFQSRTVERTADKAVRVRGELTATFPSKKADYDSSKGDAGQAFGPQVQHSVKRPASFVFRVSPEGGTRGKKRGNPEWRAISGFSREAFPELWNAVMSAYWSAIAARKRCVVPSVVGEDFSGPTCGGQATGGSKDNMANEVEIELTVHLIQENTPPNPAATGNPTAHNYKSVEVAEAGAAAAQYR